MASCSQNIYVRGDFEPKDGPAHPPLAYVSNPGESEMLAILEHSGLFTLSDDPGANTHVQLDSLYWVPIHGPLVPLWLISLGLIPDRYDLECIYTFHVFTGDDVDTYEIHLNYTSKVSIWERLFGHDKTENEVLGDVLRSEFLSLTTGDQAASN
jgi:hypothetical protein